MNKLYIALHSLRGHGLELLNRAGSNQNAIVINCSCHRVYIVWSSCRTVP